MTVPFPAKSFQPEGYHTVTPWIIGQHTAELIDWLAEVFGAVELGRVQDEETGAIGHAEVRIGDSVVMLFDSRPHWPATPAHLRLYLEDSDAAHARAVAAGAESVTEMTYLFFGDKVGRVRDPFGNLWWLHTRIEDLPEEEVYRRMQLPEFVEAMAYVSGADLVTPTAR
ncbi:VOC family protein [Crossiella sp. CA-258035]|uniref:VOC family protein n=1 Tax=Crossiella sp. CA-258035 TaxID=2981138 RepID=UPI0024BCE85B|nr:VOC family protein [Crossiella sp. CA-258035]WHT17482.1 VOC family protein [Crossiella sp. CA-258035]